jgi:hypothetical protein
VAVQIANKSDAIKKSRSDTLASFKQELSSCGGFWAALNAAAYPTFANAATILNVGILGVLALAVGGPILAQPRLSLAIENNLESLQKDINEQGAILTDVQRETELVSRTLREMEIVQRPISLFLEDSKRSKYKSQDLERFSNQKIEQLGLRGTDIEAGDDDEADEPTSSQSAEGYEEMRRQVERLKEEQKKLLEDNKRLEQLWRQSEADAAQLKEQKERANQLLAQREGKSVWQIISDWTNWILGFQSFFTTQT